MGAHTQVVRLGTGSDGENTSLVSEANPLPVSLSSGNVIITGPVTISTEVEIKNEIGNPIPVVGPLTDDQLRAAPVVIDSGIKVTAVPALGAGGVGLIGWLSQIWSALTGTLSVSGPLTDAQLRAATVLVSQASQPLPAGGSTSALQTTGNTSLASIAAKMASGPATGALSQSIVPASDAVFAIAPGASRAQVTVTRPANMTPYTAGDVVGGVIAFTAMGVAGSHAMLTSVDLRIDIAAIPSGMTSFRLYLYSVTPPSALADNAVWDLPAGDRAAFITYIDLGSPLDLGSTLFVQTDGISKHIKLGAAETALYGYLVTTTGFTPAANAEVYTPCLRAVAL